MEDRTESPRAVKVEEHSQCVILTYFQGDINSMVDAHFTRALGKNCKAKAPAAKAKKLRKTIKSGKHIKSTACDLPDYKQDNQPHPSSLHGFFLYSPAEDTSTCQGSALDSYTESQAPPLAGRLLAFGPADDAPGSWHSLTTRAGEGPGLPSIAYHPLSQEGLSLTGQQYATSLLNLLHSDRGEMGPGIASSSKPELLPSWTMPQGFRESVDPAVAFEPGKSAATIQHLRKAFQSVR